MLTSKNRENCDSFGGNAQTADTGAVPWLTLAHRASDLSHNTVNCFVAVLEVHFGSLLDHSDPLQ